MKLDRFINRPVLSTVISIFIVLLGLIGLSSLPITQYPDIAPPTISVTTTYNGANAAAVLNSVIAPLEESINGAEGMTSMLSSNRASTPTWPLSTYRTACRLPQTYSRPRLTKSVCRHASVRHQCLSALRL